MLSGNPLAGVAATAASTLTNPAELPVIAVGAAVGAAAIGVAAGVGAIYHEYKKRKHEKYIHKIDAVLALHKKWLTKFIINDTNDQKSFPAPFQYKNEEDKEHTSVDCMHFTDEQVQAFSTEVDGDVDLLKYRRAIASAIKEIKTYYEERIRIDAKKNKDVTAVVLCSLMHYLQSYCMNMESVASGIAATTQLAGFVNGYASLSGTEKSQHFVALTYVWEHIDKANELLVQHNQKLSLDDIIQELLKACYRHGSDLLRSFVKCVTPNEYWCYIPNVTDKELIDGVLRHQFVRMRIGDFDIYKKPEVVIPESVFKGWVSRLAQFSLKVPRHGHDAINNKLVPPQKIFNLSFYNRMLELRQISKIDRNKAQSDELSELEHLMDEIKSVFKNCVNFVTYKVKPKKDKPKKKRATSKSQEVKFVQVQDDAEVMKRSKILIDFATLIHQVMSLQFFCFELDYGIKELGLIYSTDPEHFCFVFGVLNDACKRVIKNALDMQRLIQNVDQDSDYKMRLNDKQEFINEIDKKLLTLVTTIRNLNNRVNEHRGMASTKMKSSMPTVKEVVLEVFSVANNLYSLYGMKDADPDLAKLAEKDIKSAERSGVGIPVLPAGIAAALATPVASAVSTTAPISSPATVVVTSPTAPLADTAYPEVIPPSPAPVAASTSESSAASSTKEFTFSKFCVLIGNIYDQLENVLSEDKPADLSKVNMAAYEAEKKTLKNLRDKIMFLLTQSVNLKFEDDKDEQREEKANNTLELGIALSKIMLNYLNLSKSDRVKSSEQFKQDIHEEFNNHHYDSLDVHSNPLSGLIYKMGHLSIFAPATRRTVAHLAEACDEVADLTAAAR